MHSSFNEIEDGEIKRERSAWRLICSHYPHVTGAKMQIQ